MNNMNNFGGNNMNNMMGGGQMYMNNGQASQVTYIFLKPIYYLLCQNMPSGQKPPASRDEDPDPVGTVDVWLVGSGSISFFKGSGSNL